MVTETYWKRKQREHRRDGLQRQADYVSYIKEWDKLLAEQSTWLKENCPHIEIIDKSHTVEGGYLDKGYTDKWRQCAYCGERGEKTRKMGYYG